MDALRGGGGAGDEQGSIRRQIDEMDKAEEDKKTAFQKEMFDEYG